MLADGVTTEALDAQFNGRRRNFTDRSGPCLVTLVADLTDTWFHHTAVSNCGRAGKEAHSYSLGKFDSK